MCAFLFCAMFVAIMAFIIAGISGWIIFKIIGIAALVVWTIGVVYAIYDHCS